MKIFQKTALKFKIIKIKNKKFNCISMTKSIPIAKTPSKLSIIYRNQKKKLNQLITNNIKKKLKIKVMKITRIRILKLIMMLNYLIKFDIKKYKRVNRMTKKI